MIASTAPAGDEAVGRSLAELADEWSTSPLEAALDLLDRTGLDATMIEHYASNEAVADRGRPPAAARRLGRYLRREAPPAAVRNGRPLPRPVRASRRDDLRRGGRGRLTARAADRLGLADRGRIAVGRRADLVLLDLDAFVDTATYEEPKQHPPGVHSVWVAGERVWHDGKPTGTRRGGVVR